MNKSDTHALQKLELYKTNQPDEFLFIGLIILVYISIILRTYAFSTVKVCEKFESLK